MHLVARHATINHVCARPGLEQQRLDEAATLPGVSDHPGGQHGAQRGQEAHRRAAEAVRRGR